MAHIPWTQVAPTEDAHYTGPVVVAEDGHSEANTNNTNTENYYSAATHALAPQVQFAPFTYANQEYVDPYELAQSASINVTQRRRPHSLPESRAGDSSSRPVLAIPPVQPWQQQQQQRQYQPHQPQDHQPQYQQQQSGVQYNTTTNVTVNYNNNNNPAAPSAPSLGGDSDQYLGDVPRPSYATNSHDKSHSSDRQQHRSGKHSGNPFDNSSLMQESGKSAIDEELECVTANLHML
jgi:hypothetical protein